MKRIKQLVGLSVLATALLLAGCRNSAGEPTPAPIPTIADTVVAQLETTVPPAPAPVTQADLDAALSSAGTLLAELANGGYREVYGTLLTADGQQKLGDLVLGRLALANPHISFFELNGAEPVDDRIAVEAVWRETLEGQGDLGSQQAIIYLVRQGEQMLVDDIELVAFTAAATPVPPPLPKAESLNDPAVAGEELRFRASGFQAGETVLSWLELADGTLLDAAFAASNEQGALEIAYSGEQTANLAPGQWIWWAQALRDSARNTGISFEVQAVTTPTPTEVPTEVPTNTPPPTPTTAPVVVLPTATRPPVAVAPTATAQPIPTNPPPAQPSGYSAPLLLWPEPLTSRDFGSALVVEFVPVTGALAANEWYELVVIGENNQGQVYNGGSVRGKGDACSGTYSSPCVKLVADERFLSGFFGGSDNNGRWYVQVVRQDASGQFAVVSPPSEARVVKFNHR
ncbi:MAG: hypothetical protein ABTQ73_14005 [Caldilineales bacterium]